MRKEPWYKRYVKRRMISEVISADGRLYLLRWHLIPRNRFFNIYLHKFIGSDKRVMHDHPWISLAYQLSGQLSEIYCRPIIANREEHATALLLKSVKWMSESRIIKKGQWTYRNSRFLHFIIPESNFECWTLFFTGPKIRDWGFITTQGWVAEKAYRKEEQ